MSNTEALSNSPEILEAIVNRGPALKIPVEPVPPPSTDKEGYVIESGAVRMAVLWASDDGTAANGLWEADPGVVRGVFLFDENDYILGGRMTVTPEGGEPFEVKAGDSIFFPNGSYMTWEIHETLRKHFSIHNPDGLPLG